MFFKAESNESFSEIRVGDRKALMESGEHYTGAGPVEPCKINEQSMIWVVCVIAPLVNHSTNNSTAFPAIFLMQ